MKTTDIKSHYPAGVEYADMDNLESRSKERRFVQLWTKKENGTLTEEDKKEIRNDVYLNKTFNQIEKRNVPTKKKLTPAELVELKKYQDDLQRTIDKYRNKKF